VSIESASFAVRGDPEALRREFVQKMTSEVVRHCATRLTPAQLAQCVTEAGLSSGWGRFALGNNYWMLPGRGDAGSFLLVRIARDYTAASAVRPVIQRFAKFSSLPAALDAWCRRSQK
jgi:hypothetical protein